MTGDQIKDPGNELDLARICLDDARAVLATSPRIAAREAYLVAFHAAQARIAALGRPTGTHKGVGLEIGKLYKDTDFPAQRRLSELESWKSAADYGRGAAADEMAARQAIDDAEAFLSRMKSDIGALGVAQELTAAEMLRLEAMRRGKSR